MFVWREGRGGGIGRVRRISRGVVWSEKEEMKG